MLSAVYDYTNNRFMPNAFPVDFKNCNIIIKGATTFSNGKNRDDQNEEGTYGLWITDGNGYNIAASKGYEILSGLKASEFIGLHMSDMLKQKVLDNSATLKVLAEKKPFVIPQTILPNKRKLLASGTPIYDQNGNIIFVVTTVRPYNDFKEESIDTGTTLYIEGVGKIVSKSPAMQDVLSKASRAACFNSTVIITGESGVGKEVVARLIHHLSRRNNGPFVRVNAGAIPAELFESELFGYKAGAFTGAAHGGKKGLVQAAHGGTLFLDEIGELPISMQVKLLRLLQEREFFPVGATQPVRADVRFIAATNRNLRELVDQGKFREDLYYRLNVVPINIPPLRQRPEDILELINHFLTKMKRDYHIYKHFTSDAISLLLSYEWPGNVRELENLIERIVVLYPDKEITKSIVQEELGLLNSTPGLIINGLEISNLQNAVQEFEKKLIMQALGDTNSLETAAKKLGIHRTTLLRKIQKYKIWLSSIPGAPHN